MIPRLLPVLLCALALSTSRGADEETPHTNMKDALRARMIEDARKTPPRPPAKSATAPAADAASPSTAPSSRSSTATTPNSAPAATTGLPISPTTTASGATASPTTVPVNATPATSPDALPVASKRGQAPAPGTSVLPKVEVKKGRITVLDQQLAKQEEDIARERKNLKTTETDLVLNDSKVAKPLAIFGGESAQFRKRVASERVELMEAEKDIIEAMARAKTKAEKDELQKQLDEIRTFRRELDKTLR